MKKWPDWTKEEKLLKSKKIELQPDNQKLFGHLVVTEEVTKAGEEKWNNTFKNHFDGFNKPIDHLNKSKINGEWGYGKSFNQLLKGELADQELAERNMDVVDR